MIPNKANKERKEYIELHYKLQKHYRTCNRYVPFRYIQRKIQKKWQLHCYEKNNLDIKLEEYEPTIRWSEELEHVKLF